MAASSRPEAPLAAAEAARVAALLDFWFGAPGTPEHGRERAVWFGSATPDSTAPAAASAPIMSARRPAPTMAG